MYSKKMRHSISWLSLLVLFLFLSLPASRTKAAETSDGYQHVYDKAGLLSTDEITDLDAKCISYGETGGVEIMILTHNDSSAPYAEDYIENFEDQLPAGDRVYLLVDMYNRVVFMEGYGTAETYIHSKRIDAIIKEITPNLSEGNYYDAFLTYIERSAAYMKDDSELNTDHDYSAGKPQSSDPNAPNYDETWPDNYNSSGNEAVDILSNLWVQLFISAIIAIVTVAVMASHSGGKMTAGAGNYLDQSHSGLIGRRDDYLQTTVTRVRKPQDNNNNNGGGFNSGGFRGGVSGGGRSHSSGGGSF